MAVNSLMAVVFRVLISKLLPSANVIGVASTCMACSRDFATVAPHDRIITALGHRYSQAITRTRLAYWSDHDPRPSLFFLGDLKVCGNSSQPKRGDN